MGKGLRSKLDYLLHGKIYFTTIGCLNAMSQSAKHTTFFLTHPVYGTGTFIQYLGFPTTIMTIQVFFVVIYEFPTHKILHTGYTLINENNARFLNIWPFPLAGQDAASM